MENTKMVNKEIRILSADNGASPNSKDVLFETCGSNAGRAILRSVVMVCHS